MDNEIVVNENPDEIQPQVVIAPEEVFTPPAPAPGDKTDPNLLLKSLQEEREKRRAMEEELELLKSSTVSEQEAFSDEGKLLEKKITDLASEITTLRQESAKKDVLLSHPELKDKWEEFEAFRQDPENKGMNLRTAAKAYMIETGLIAPTPRKGLETTTGGTREPVSTQMTADDVKKLRETNYKKYVDMLQKGQIPNLS